MLLHDGQPRRRLDAERRRRRRPTPDDRKGATAASHDPVAVRNSAAFGGVVWLSLGSPDVNAAATYTFSAFSHVLWPIFVPFAVLMLEGDPRRRRILRGLLTIGTGVGLYLLFYILKDGITAQFSGLVSSHPAIRILGAVMLTSFAIAGVLFTTAFISVWCFFAAILSVVVYVHLKRPGSVSARLPVHWGYGRLRSRLT